MARDATFQANVAWHEKHQECRLSILVNVSQANGTTGTIYQTDYVNPVKADMIKLAQYQSDSTDNSSEARWEVVSRLLEAHAMRVARAKELDTRPY